MAAPAVCGDQERLVETMLHLSSNAVKFTPHGGSTTCSARRAGEQVVLDVSDTGIGIAPAGQARVFEQFVQIGDTLTGSRRVRASA